ncbi:hypothetical protein QYM36_012664 [Artemia franciscana]|uniref:Luc7-like protein 3 n=1 Tax=Artemia franciscana TaxID=6661 RepID=A0AA88HJQ7_ARTSF|nr:hypothetical protein QYM36_012664 [Artemia franciscana]
MVSMAAQLLDELMGRHRNTLPNENSKEPSYHDPDVCKHYTSVFCPHDLFTNTKADLGVCGKVHDDMVREKYQKDASAVTREQFEDDFIRYARQILGEVDKRIVKGKQRLQTQFPEKGSNDREGCEEKVVLLTDKINHLIEEAEKEGCEGNIEQAQGLLKLCDQLKEERDQFRKQLDGTAQNYQGVDPFAQEKQMEICTVCGAFLIIGDAQSRLDDHLQGKMHVGYTRLRSAIDEILLIEKTREFQQKAYVAFVDFKAAFDSIDRQSLWLILKTTGLPVKYCNLFERLHEGTESCVQVNGRRSSSFKINIGLERRSVKSGRKNERTVETTKKKERSEELKWRKNAQKETENPSAKEIARDQEKDMIVTVEDIVEAIEVAMEAAEMTTVDMTEDHIDQEVTMTEEIEGVKNVIGGDMEIGIGGIHNKNNYS